MNILAIDLGGMSAKVALLTREGKILKRWKIKTDLNNLWGNIKNNLTNLSDDEYQKVSVSMPGFINHQRSVVTLSGNLKLKNYDVKKELVPFFGNKEFYVLNDGNAAVLGEYWKGAAKDENSTILYILGTGVGGGLVINGNLVFGAHGYAGELGHGGYFQDEYPCTCGLKHCLEPLSSATGMIRLLKAKGYDLTLEEAGLLWKKGDQKIQEIFVHALKPLAKHISIMQTAFNPDSILIGGGPSAMGSILSETIALLVKQYQLSFISDSTPIKIAKTQNDAGILGAAYWALQKTK